MRTTKLLYIVLLLTLISGSSWASCGPEAKIKTYYDIDQDKYWSSSNGDSGGLNYNGNEIHDHHFDRDWNKDNDSSYGIMFEISFPLTNIECEKIEAQTAKEKAQTRKEKYNAAEKKADAMEQRLRNFEKIVKICKIDKTLEVCSRLNKMSKELGLD